jgi:UDP-4-amino-4,6-dideoxy-N-acetyl-beta-L-altrosamine N-acetyltransferase
VKNIEFNNILEVDEDLKEKVRCWRNKDDIRKAMLSQHIITKKEHARWLKHLKEEDDYKCWIIFFRGKPIGTIYLHEINYQNLSSKWGWYIAEDIYRGKGLSRPIFLKLMGLFFNKMKFANLITDVISNNEKALGIYKKFKFREIARSPFKDKYEVITFGFSKDDWKNMKAG